MKTTPMTPRRGREEHGSHLHVAGREGVGRHGHGRQVLGRLAHHDGDARQRPGETSPPGLNTLAGVVAGHGHDEQEKRLVLQLAIKT